MMVLSMMFFKIRSPRVSVEIPISIFLKDRDSGVISRESLSGVLVQLSKGGARAVVSKVMLDGNHIFFSTLEHKRFYLYIPSFSIGNQGKYELNAISAWMDSCIFDGQPSFKIGMNFLDQQKELFALVKKKKL
jgi:hypothetical protein